MITVSELTARAARGPRLTVGPVTLTVEAGTKTALVGKPDAGPPLLLAVLAGALAPRSGSARVGDAPASAGPAVAYVPYDAQLPGFLRVADYLDVAARVRGEPRVPPRERLAVLGVAALADRRIGRLATPEARAVALVEALTSARARVLLLEEPLADVDPRAVGRVQGLVDERARAGVTVVVSTASHADARALGDALVFFHDGKVAGRATRDEAWQAPRAEGAEGPGRARVQLLIRSEGARLLHAS